MSEARRELVEAVRVVTVGPRTASVVSGLADDDAVSLVAHVDMFDEVVDTMDSVQPDVVMLGPESLRGAFRLGGSPAGVIVVPTTLSGETSAETETIALKVAVLLAASQPRLQLNPL